MDVRGWHSSWGLVAFWCFGRVVVCDFSEFGVRLELVRDSLPSTPLPCYHTEVLLDQSDWKAVLHLGEQISG